MIQLLKCLKQYNYLNINFKNLNFKNYYQLY